ncbi:hypothetical protein ACC691_36700, partial [Rhizobium johnstonii]|uniref:hypothetical protein n=1 Tax=Rhizobium johnstonii TaxID=3019933 RepID=UPI003F9651F6
DMDGPAGDDLGTGVAFDCGDAAACVPAAYVPAIDNNIASLLIVGVLAVVATVVFVLIDRSATRAVVIGICIAAALVVVVGAWFLFGRESFFAFAHFAAAFVFFVLIAAIAVFNAVVLNVDRRRHVLPVAG